VRPGDLGVFEFPSGQPRRQQRKNGARNLLGVDAGVAMHPILNALRLRGSGRPDGCQPS
jgi:hypothetical protein